MTLEASIATLTAHRDNLTANDRSFADSLLYSVRTQRRPPSDKQLYWIGKMAERAKNGGKEPERVKTTVGDLSGVMALFDKARRHLQFPAIVLGWRDSRDHIHEVRLNVAGERARVPGSINVIDEADRAWFGRILKDGAFEHSPRIDVPTAVAELLGRFACDPVGVAGEHGRLTGKCCFCNTALTDERSTSVGYGPTCAKNYGLPWGKAAADARQAELAVAA
jgi:hypothetical protein